jgi:hypothetical protein
MARIVGDAGVVEHVSGVIGNVVPCAGFSFLGDRGCVSVHQQRSRAVVAEMTRTA